MTIPVDLKPIDDPVIWAGISGSISLRSTEALRASAHPGNDPGRIDHVIAMGEQAKRLNEESKHDPRG